MNTHEYKTSSLGRWFCLVIKQVLTVNSKPMAAQYLRKTGDKEPLLSEKPAQIKPSFRLPHTYAGTTALLAFTTSDHQDEGFQHRPFPTCGSSLRDAYFTPHLCTDLADLVGIPGKGYYKTLQRRDMKVIYPPRTDLVENTSTPGQTNLSHAWVMPRKPLPSGQSVRFCRLSARAPATRRARTARGGGQPPTKRCLRGWARTRGDVPPGAREGQTEGGREGGRCLRTR